jgi:HAD superfamily phosphatase
MVKPQKVLIFDMDGVLVDVRCSYRETIRATVAHFSGQEVTAAQIQDYKNRGGWNDDWALSQQMIRDASVEVPIQTVVDYFQSVFHGGSGRPGLILQEHWIARDGLIERLGKRFQLAIFSGRPRGEVALTLKRFAAQLDFAPIVSADDVAHPKPAPDGLLKIAAQAPDAKLWYIGDTVDDGRAAQAAGIPFIGIASSKSPQHDALVAALQAEDPIAILEDINQLEMVLCE